MNKELERILEKAAEIAVDPTIGRNPKKALIKNLINIFNSPEIMTVEDDISTKEMTDVLYDTLMQNLQYPQFTPDLADEVWCDAEKGEFSFKIGESKYIISILKC